MSNVSGEFSPIRPVPTGNLLVRLNPDVKLSKAVKHLEKSLGKPVAVASDFSTSGSSQQSDQSNYSIILDDLNLAVIKNDDQDATASFMTILSASEDVLDVRKEFYFYPVNDLRDRLQVWMESGSKLLQESQRSNLSGVSAPALVPDKTDTSLNNTWGLKATGVNLSPYSGKGIKIAVLDTGFDLHHPDFSGRTIVHRSFVPGETAQDVNGHGTHCIGTAAGPLASPYHPRYGVAHEADIYVGKVLSNSGFGQEGWILEGIDWAIKQGCEIISMSLGRSAGLGDQPDILYESAGSQALARGSLIIAAAGNDSARKHGYIAPVNYPANSPSIMAVASVDQAMDVSDFSCGGVNHKGGEVNISAPGEDIYSSVPVPKRYARLGGTSMAAPHVAGIAALYAQSDPNLRGRALWEKLLNSCEKLQYYAVYVGKGFVQMS